MGRIRVIAIVVAGVLGAVSLAAAAPDGPRDIVVGRSALGATTTTTAAPLALTSEAPTRTTAAPPVVALDEVDPTPATLESGRSCAELLDAVRTEAHRVVTPFGLPGTYGFATAAALGSGVAGAVTPASAATGGTNVQEAGIDEPDGAKLDDGVVVSLRGGAPWYGQMAGDRVTDLRTGTHAQLPGLDSLTAHDALFADGRLAVIGSGFHERSPGVVEGREFVVTYDLRDPARPTETGRTMLAGWYHAARVVDGRIHVVTGARPSIEWDHPQDGSPTESDRALAENHRRIDASTIADWVPMEVPCERVHAPAQLSTFSLTIVSTLTTTRAQPASVTAAFADAATAYASARSLVVTAGRFDQAQVSSPVHRFALGDDVVYGGTATVVGTVGDQFQLSEFDGVLRVVSDLQPGVRLTTLRIDEDALTPLATFDDFPADHSSFGIRFLGPMAYVVTFVAPIDPLHVVDLTDPAHPRGRGRIEAPGYSTYLHPIGDDRLLGIGYSDAMRQHNQVVIDDVGRPDEPVRRASLDLDPSQWTPAAVDHHAFTWDANRGRALLAGSGGTALVIGTAGDQAVVVGSLSHPSGAVVSRAFVDGDTYVTVSVDGVAVHDAATLAPLRWIPFAATVTA